ncbi:MAG: hypothetical protein LBR88_04500 [Zoogloeaceae bacterium]|jgi:hypothetical protein|nr:hypothetical protein [Zoogloeaceae bacterium]
MRFSLFPLLLAATLMAACSRDTPESALKATASELQSALETRAPDKVLALLHDKFTTQDSTENGRDWARRTMTLSFTRYKTVSIVTQNMETRIDPRFPDHATSKGEALLVGAENILPDSTRRYRIELEWVREKDEWKLLRLAWQ